MSCIALCILAGAFSGEPPAQPDVPQAWLEVHLSRSGRAVVGLIIQTDAPIQTGPVGPALRAVVGLTGGRERQVIKPPDYRWTGLSGEIGAIKSGEGLGELDLGPLLAELRRQGVPELYVLVHVPPEWRSPDCRLDGGPMPQTDPATFGGTIATDAGAADLSVAFGDLPVAVPGDARWLWLLSVVPVGAAIVAWRMRRLAARLDLDAATLGFRYMRFQSLLPLGTVVAWLGAIAISAAAAHAGGWLGGPGAAARAVRWGLCGYLPTVAITLLALGVTAPVVRRLREMDWPLTNVVQRSAVAPLLAFADILFFWLGIAALLGEEPRIGAGLIGAALAVWIGSSRRRQRTLQLTPIPLTHGELRDRVAALAAFFRVKVPQVGLLPSDRSRLANAYPMR
jgi:hypothetical protein